MKNLTLIICLGILLGSCSDDEIVKKEGVVSNKLDVKLAVKDNIKTWNILELVEFYGYSDNVKYIRRIYSEYDSLMWRVEGEKGAFEIYKSCCMVHSWSHNFFYPGKYDTFLVGYKDGKEFYSDTLTLNIVNQKHFLCYNWDEIKETPTFLGYENVLSNYFNLGTRPVVNNGNPGVFVGDLNIHDEGSEKEKNTLKTYITSLYGDPVCDLDSPKHVQEKYYNEFKYKPEGETPIYYWISPNARIMLYKKKHDYYDTYEVYAEPFYN